MAFRITYDPLYIKLRDHPALINDVIRDYYMRLRRFGWCQRGFSDEENSEYDAKLAELTSLEKQVEKLMDGLRLDHYTKEYLILIKRGFPKDIIHYILTKFL